MRVKTGAFVKTSEAKQANSSFVKKHTTPSIYTNSPAEQLLFLQGTIGNQAVQSLIKSHSEPFKVSIQSRVDPRLPIHTPAWTEEGYTHLAPAFFFMNSDNRQKLWRHEAVHRIHQRLAPPNETASAHTQAERLAKKGEMNLGELSINDFLHPAPSLLAYPPQNFSPWTRVWIGNAGIIGEIKVGSVPVRIFKSYSELKITKLPEYKTYRCGKHDMPPIPSLAKGMRKVASKTLEINNKIPESAKQYRIALVIISQNVASAYRTANNRGLVIINEKNDWVNTAAHEGGHAILWYHVSQKKLNGKPIDPFALRIADIYDQLSKTNLVPQPTTKFDPKNPPPLTVSSQTTTGKPAGLVMVHDTLWSGAGGHPWNVDEFFASAYGAFLQDPGLLRQIISYYQKADLTIKKPAQELLTLLSIVGHPSKLSKLTAPKGSKLKAAQAIIAREVSVPVDVTQKTEGRISEIIDPATMPSPTSIRCPGSTVPSGKSVEDILKEEMERESGEEDKSIEDLLKELEEEKSE